MVLVIEGLIPGIDRRRQHHDESVTRSVEAASCTALTEKCPEI
jgi:hypothetical protein